MDAGLTSLPAFTRRGKPLIIPDQVAALAHCQQPHAKDYSALSGELSALRRESNRLWRRLEKNKATKEEVVAYRSLRPRAIELIELYSITKEIEVRKIQWALQAHQADWQASKTLSQCLTEGLVTSLPTERSDVKTASAAVSISDASAAAVDCFYSLPLGCLNFALAFGGTMPFTKGAVELLLPVALAEVEKGWRPDLAQEFRKTTEFKQLHRQHVAKVRHPMVSIIGGAYVIDAVTYDSFMDRNGLKQLWSIHSTGALVKKANRDLESLLYRHAKATMGEELAVHLFKRLLQADPKERPSVLEFFRLLEDYDPTAFFPGVPEFDLKPRG